MIIHIISNTGDHVIILHSVLSPLTRPQIRVILITGILLPDLTSPPAPAVTRKYFNVYEALTRIPGVEAFKAAVDRTGLAPFFSQTNLQGTMFVPNMKVCCCQLNII